MQPRRKISKYMGQWSVAILVVFGLGAALLLPGIGVPGLWEPGERQLADQKAPPIAIEKEQEEARRKALATQPQQPKPPEVECKKVPPEDPVARSLSNRLMKFGRDEIGDSDRGRKLPFALLGLLTLLATAGIAMRFAGGRGGIVTAVVVVSMPLLVLQSRMLTSDIGTACGAALIVYGFLAIRSARDAVRTVMGAFKLRTFSLSTIDVVIGSIAICAGIVIGFMSGGALLGLLVPLGAVAIAGKLGIPFLVDIGKAIYNGSLRVGRRSKWTLNRAPLEYSGESYGPALIATLATIAVVGLLAYQIYDLKDPHPGILPPARRVGDLAIVPEGCWSWVLGGIWRPEDDLRYVFDSTFEQIAYGTFPWGILGPIAMVLLVRDEDPKKRLIGTLTLVWAAGAWIACEVFHRKVGITIWPGFPALAIAIGVWFDGVLEKRSKGDPGRGEPRGAGEGEGGGASARPNEGAMPAGVLLLGLFFALAVLDFGKDIVAFPDKMTSLIAGTEVVQYPADSRLLFLKTKLWVLGLGMLVAIGVCVTLVAWRPGESSLAKLLRRIANWAVAGAFGASILLAGFWAFAWHPRIAQHLSSKAMFETYRDLRNAGDELHIMGDLGYAPQQYADTKRRQGFPPADLGFEKAVSRDQIVNALKRDQRVFAIAPQSELCPMHREMGEKPYYVIDDRNTRNLLFSNKLTGATDKNPLREMIVHEQPKQISKKPKSQVVWDNRIELLGWDMPASVQRGTQFDVTIYYKILQPVGGNWTAIMHFDGAIRFSGDHKPIKDRCPTSTWQPGDYIIDRHTVVAGGAGHPLGKYELWIGFFTGTAPNFKNMTISAAPSDMRDANDRVKITSVVLD